MAQKEYLKYDPHKQYSIILLLAGENIVIDKAEEEIKKNPDYYPRSKKAAEVLKSGKIDKGIIVTGGYGGFDRPSLGISGGERSFNYLLQLEKIPYEYLFFDDRSRETLGNFALPADSRMVVLLDNGFKTSPDFSELESILLITEEGHMKRALECAEKAIPCGQMDYLAVEGPYRPGFVTRNYHTSLMCATRHITKPNPRQVVDFLENEHPFYKHGDEKLFKEPLLLRKFELGATCIWWRTSAIASQKIQIKIT